MKVPSSIPKYVIDYIVHKEASIKLFLNGFRSHLFDLKNDVFPPLPFYVGSYKFTKVNNALEFVKELENFHFGEKDFHRNDSQGKVVAYKAALKVNFEYVDYIDKEEEKNRNIYGLTALNKKLMLKTIEVEDKGSGSSNLESKNQEEEASRKVKEETARILAEGARNLLAEEK